MDAGRAGDPGSAAQGDVQGGVRGGAQGASAATPTAPRPLPPRLRLAIAGLVAFGILILAGFVMVIIMAAGRMGGAVERANQARDVPLAAQPPVQPVPQPTAAAPGPGLMLPPGLMVRALVPIPQTGTVVIHGVVDGQDQLWLVDGASGQVLRRIGVH